MASFRGLAIGALRLAGVTNLAKATRHNARDHLRPLPFIGITNTSIPLVSHCGSGETLDRS
jgi:hypothetical protein